MKATITTLILFFAYFTYAQNKGWDLQIQHGKNETVKREGGNNVFFLDSLNGWITAQNGIIKATTNGGENWSDIKIPSEEMITNIFFLNKNVGWVTDDKNKLFFHTINGGASWEKIPIDIENLWIVHKLKFLDSNIGFFISNGILYETRNGGKNWTTKFGAEKHITSYCFIDLNNGWLLHRLGAMRTSDGGKNWIESKNLSIHANLNQYPFWNEGIYCDISFADKNNGIITAVLTDTLGYLLVTSDGGKSWKRKVGPEVLLFSLFAFPEELIDQPESFYTKLQIQYIDNKNIFLKTIERVYYTSDAFDSYEVVNTNMYPNYHKSDICFLTKNNGVISSPIGVFNTTNRGKTWTTQSELPLQTLNDIYFIGPRIGYSVGNGGIILKTTNGGETWQNLKSLTQNNLLTVFFLTENLGWITSEKGEILHTKDGGEAWDIQKFGQQITDYEKNERVIIVDRYPDMKYPVFFPNRVQMASLNVGWCFGTLSDWGEDQEFSVLYQTDDGGGTWNVLEINESFLFSDYLVQDRLNIYAIDDNSIYKSEDGCKTWGKLTIDIPNISFHKIIRLHAGQLHLNTSRGLAIYDIATGKIEENQIQFQTYGTNAFFVSKEKGWLIMPEMVYETLDGGLNWHKILQDNFLQHNINSYCVINKNIWLVGDNGLIIRLADNRPDQEEQKLNEINEKIDNIRGFFRK